MSNDAFVKSLVTLGIIVVGLSLIVGGRRGPSRLFRFLFAPGISCVGRIIGTVVALVILGFLFAYAVPRVLAPGTFRIPGIPLPQPPAASQPQEESQRTPVVLEVPFNKQELPTTGMKNNICGYASLSMAAGYVCGFQPSMETNVKILSHLGLSMDGQDLSTARNIIKAGREMYELSLSSATWSIDQVKSEVGSGHPVIVGITAGEIPRSIRGYDYAGGHYLVVVGYDQSSLIVNDPGTKNGYRKHYPNDCFATAFRSQGSQVIIGFSR